MEPIISPWLIYFLGIADAINLVLGIVFVGLGVGIFALILASVFSFAAGEGCDDKDVDVIRGRACKKAVKRLIAPLVLSLFMVILMPSKNTIIGMIVAKNITRDNIASVIKAGKSIKEEVKSDLADIIRLIANGGEVDKDD